MDEWDLQCVLTRQWTESGLCIDGRRHVLVGWEIMLPSWLINDPDKHWTEPSLDFLVADEKMQLTVIELKTKIPGVKPAWQALCQVTHRAAELSSSLSLKNIDQAYLACSSRNHGRSAHLNKCKSFIEHHRNFLAPRGIGMTCFQRYVVALQPASSEKIVRGTLLNGIKTVIFSSLSGLCA